MSSNNKNSASTSSGGSGHGGGGGDAGRGGALSSTVVAASALSELPQWSPSRLTPYTFLEQQQQQLSQQQQQQQQQNLALLASPLSSPTIRVPSGTWSGQQYSSSHLPSVSTDGFELTHPTSDAIQDPVQPNEQQLSQDLALFLANPSLRAALADGSLDLASYSGQVEEELQQVEQACIHIYREKRTEIASLHTELTECQAVLAALHEMLLGFQADLGGLSVDIRQLQEKSRLLDVQLKNRKAAEVGLHHFLRHAVIAPSLAHAITTGPVNTVFLQSVRELNQIYKDTHHAQPVPWACDVAPADTVAGQEMQRMAHQLRGVAVTRIREYLLKQMSALRRPQTNIRMIQVHGLLRYAPLQDFLEEACPTVANEIFNVYVESMSKTLQQLFRTYQAQLLQLDATRYAATRQDVIAIEDAVLRDALTTRAKKRVDVFSLGQRASECLVDDAAYYEDHLGGGSGAIPATRHQPILAHVALSENIRYPYERLFRSLLGHLVDAVTNEHVFCRQFFKRDAFGPLFNPTLSLIQEQLENYLFGCYDAICLLLMIKVTHQFRRCCRQRKIHSLDGFFTQVTALLWPRLKTVMDHHIRSLRTATAAKLGGVDEHAHYVSRRFGEFCCSILLILHSTQQQQQQLLLKSRGSSNRKVNATGSGSNPPKTPPPPQIRTSTSSASANSEFAPAETAGDKLLEDLGMLMDDYFLLLDRLAEEHSTQKNRIVFMINNLDQVVCIFQERRVVGKELNRLVEMLMQQREMFVEEELLTGFSKMIAFVQQTEAHITELPKHANYQDEVNIHVVETLVMDFASNWKSHIDQINRNVLSYFSNFRNGMEILKQVLTQLLLYYTRFQDVIRKIWRNKPPTFCKDLVSTTVILVEIKKYALAI